MPREVDFVNKYTPNDRHRRRHLSEKGRILKFVVQFETKIGDHWYPVVRYDTAHGYVHRDLMHPGKPVEKTFIGVVDFNKGLTLAEADVRKNWQEYKTAFLKEWQKYENKKR
jgi:hypothetical protein